MYLRVFSTRAGLVWLSDRSRNGRFGPFCLEIETEWTSDVGTPKRRSECLTLGRRDASDLDALCQLQSIFYVDAEESDGALDFGMTEKV